MEGINHAINELGSGQTNIIERLKIIDERLESKEAERNDQTNCEIIKKQKDDELKKHEEYKENKRTLETDEQNIKKREELLEKEKELMHNHEQQMMKLLGRYYLGSQRRANQKRVLGLKKSTKLESIGDKKIFKYS